MDPKLVQMSGDGITRKYKECRGLWGGGEMEAVDRNGGRIEEQAVNTAGEPWRRG